MGVNNPGYDECRAKLSTASDLAENYCKDIVAVKSVGSNLFEMLIERVGDNDVTRIGEIKAMLEFMRGFTSCLPTQEEKFSVSDLMIRAKDYISVMGLGPDAKITTECTDDGCAVYGNKELAYFILTTVLRNGLIYRHGRIGKVSTAVTPCDDGQRASVVFVVETAPKSGFGSLVREALNMQAKQATSTSVHLLRELCKYFDGDAVILERDDITIARVELYFKLADNEKEG